MIHGKWGVHALCMPNNTKMANQIVIKFKRIAHHTQRNIHTQKHLRDDWWRQYLPFVSGTHWTLVYFTHKQRVMRGLWHSYKCSREQTVELTFELPVVWGVIVLISTYEISYSFELLLWFTHSLPQGSFTRTMMHTCTVSVCRRTDRRTYKVKPITNIPPPPSQEENGIAIARNTILC